MSNLEKTLKEKLSKSENFLIKANVNQNEWKQHWNYTENGIIELYTDQKEIIGISHKKWPMVDEMEEVIIDINKLSELIEFFKQNGEKDAVILYVKKDRPLFITDEKIWGTIAPRVGNETYRKLNIMKSKETMKENE